MEIDFKEPNLYLYTLMSSEDNQVELRDYLIERLNITVYRRCIDNGILQYNRQDLDHMNKEITKKLKSFEILKEENTDNEAYIFEINKQKCEFYAQIFDMENFESLCTELVEKDKSSSLKMDILMCKIRMSIILKDRISLITNVENAQSVFEASCDWDRKNRFRVYLGLFYLMKAEFSSAATHFSDCLASFDAKEILPFEKVILYLVFCSMLAFSRGDLKQKIIDNAEVRKCKEFLPLPECLYNCQYQDYFRKLLDFIEVFEDDIFLFQFKEHFCKEMKVKGYHQLLLSYQSLHLSKMAQVFSVEATHVEEDLRNFINERRLPCIIDGVDGVVRVREMRKDDDLRESLLEGEKVLRNIKKCIN